ncbi:MAG: hypothetical protein IKM97_06220 [Clostridia bacterium]|nr:hypothetical protein [Clostridia bacterium]
MIDLKFTDEDIEMIKKYKIKKYSAINQLLISNSLIDLNILMSCDKDSEEYRFYTKDVIKENIELIIKLYEIMLKSYYKKENKDTWLLSYSTTVPEIERLKNEIYIDNFLITTSRKEKIKNQSLEEMPALLNIIGDGCIPILNIDEALGLETKEPEILISPFTKIKEFKENEQIALEDEKILRIYTVILEKQDLQEITEEERKSIYNYIISSTEVVDQKLKEAVENEKDKIEINEEIRKLEVLLKKYEQDVAKKIQLKDYLESEKNADSNDIKRIKDNINSLEDKSLNIFEEKKLSMDFITKWKKNISVYIMAEFRELEIKYEEEAKAQDLKENKKMKKLEENAIIKQVELEKESVENIAKAVNKECDENIIITERLINDIQKLIIKQQNHAKIAENIGAKYCALNNGFESKKKAELLLEKVKYIKDKAREVCENINKSLLSEKLLEISKVNLQINVLLNYLNNPKSNIGQSKITRFEEMSIIEENELKRAIASKILSIRGEAELKKLKDDLEILEQKGAFKRLIGFFTGSNKLDVVKEEQIEIRQKAIRKTLSQKMSLVYNYSIHELVAEIEMFLNDNEDDELVETDYYILKNMEDELRRNFIISDSKVNEIIEAKEKKNLPVEVKKISKRELIEIETYRFLNKYGYDIRNDDEEPEYKDTCQDEISNIIDYINNSNI